MVSGLQIESGGGSVALTSGGDIVAGDKITVQLLVHQVQHQTSQPYKFLSYYEINDRDIFFGRQLVIDEIFAAVQRFPLVLLNGQAGAGKTSLINAGVLPRLTDEDYTYIRFRDYSNPIAQFRTYFGSRWPNLAAQSAEQVEFVDILALLRAQTPKMILVLDQFERFFLSVSEHHRELFIEAIGKCLSSDSLKGVSILIGVREDFLGRLITEFDDKLPHFLQDNKLVNLRPLQAVDARMAILRPLRDVPKVGYDPQFVDTTLIPQLIRQSPGEDVIEPSQLQIVCNRLFLAAQQKLSNSQDEGQVFLIDQILYNELGGARGILESYLDEVVNRVAEGKTEQVKLVRSILKLMIQSGNARKFVSIDDMKRNLPDVT